MGGKKVIVAPSRKSKSRESHFIRDSRERDICYFRQTLFVNVMTIVERLSKDNLVDDRRDKLRRVDTWEDEKEAEKMAIGRRTTL